MKNGGSSRSFKVADAFLVLTAIAFLGPAALLAQGKPDTVPRPALTPGSSASRVGQTQRAGVQKAPVPPQTEQQRGKDQPLPAKDQPLPAKDQPLPAKVQPLPAWTAAAHELRLHLIGNAHVDAVWLWPWVEADAVVHSTFQAALDRMNEDPDVAMTTSSSQFYAWVAESDPELLAAIRKRVEEGRWNLVGGWWVEPDVNMPSGEALARQGLYGQRTLERLFGRMATTGYNPDSFGHPGSLPQILKLQGMSNYVFMRPGPTEKTLPESLFWWQGIDGTRALTFRIPVAYNTDKSVDLHMRRVVDLFAEQPVKTAMEFFGVGDHGGGPTRASMRDIRAIQSQPGAPKVLYSTPDRYFSEVRQSLPADLAVVKDDLQHHSVGCYTAGSEIKKGNRMSEAALVTAEKFAAIGSAAWGAAYPKADFTAAWERVLFLQFHDSLAGTTLPEHFESAREGYGRALDTAHQAMDKTALRLAWQVPATDPESQYLVVFNSNGWSVKQNIEYDLAWDRKAPSRVEDEQGRPVAFQWTDPTTAVLGRARLVAQVEVPAFGYRQIQLRKDAAGAVGQQRKVSAVGDVRVTQDVLENEHLRVSFSPDGTLGIFDKDAGKEVFKGGQTGARAVVLNDTSDTWSHHVVAYTDEIGAFQQKERKVVEDGPMRARVRVRSAYGASTLTTDWILYAGSRDLEARVSLDWHEHLKMLRYSFPVDVAAPQATYEIPYGAMARGNKGDEDPGQRWIDVSGSRDGKPYGLAVVNDAKYGYSVLGGDMRVSIVRSPVYAHHEPYVLDPKRDYQWMDQGVQTFRMVLMPHAGSWQSSGVTHVAEELVSPAPVIYQGIHGGQGSRNGQGVSNGGRAQSDSFLSVDASDVVISTVKQAEDGDDIIVRAYEAEGRPARATVDLRFAKTRWSGEFRPYEIKTLRVSSHGGTVSEVNLLER